MTYYGTMIIPMYFAVSVTVCIGQAWIDLYMVCFDSTEQPEQLYVQIATWMWWVHLGSHAMGLVVGSYVSVACCGSNSKFRLNVQINSDNSWRMFR